MAYAYVVDVPAPVEVYDAVHAAIDRRSGGADGMVVHLARATATGFQVLEVWGSNDQSDRFDADVVGPAMAAVGTGDEPEPVREEFEPHALIAPGVRAATPS